MKEEERMEVDSINILLKQRLILEYDEIGNGTNTRGGIEIYL